LSKRHKHGGSFRKAVQGLYIGFLEKFKGNALLRLFTFGMLAKTLYKGDRAACLLFVKNILSQIRARVHFVIYRRKIGVILNSVNKRTGF